jgi:hypothetical protein
MNSEMEQQVISRETLTNKIKRWVQLDTQLKLINEKTKMMRDERGRLSGEICMDLQSAGISKQKIILPDGDLKIYEKKDYSPLTFVFLEQHLGNIMSDPQQVSFVIDYLKQKREIKCSNDLKRTYK